MFTRHLRLLERAFYPLVIVATVGTLAATSVVIGPTSAVKGGYVLVGVLVAFAISRGLDSDGTGRRRTRSSGRYAKLVVVAWMIGVSLAVLTGNRLYGLLVGLPIGYALLGRQFQFGASPVSLLLQTALLFSLGPFTKYLTNGFYFGDGDVFHNTRWMNELVATGRLESLDRYADFPGYHLLGGTVSLVTDLPAYDVVMIVQVLAYFVLVLIAFLLVRTMTGDERFASVVALGTTCIFWVSFYVTIGFPQTIATVLVAYLLYLAFRVGTPALHARLFAFSLLLSLTLVLTHHLTILMFAPLIVLILIAPFVSGYLSRVAAIRSKVSRPRELVLVIPGVLAVTHWMFQRQFLGEMVYFFRNIVIDTLLSYGLFVTDEKVAETTYVFGRTLPPIRIESAVRSLGSLEGIYFALLVTVCVLGVHRAIVERNRYSNVLDFCAVGVLGAPLILRSPIAPSYDRIRLPFALFFAFLVGLGLVDVLRTDRGSKSAQALLLVVIVLLGTLTPIVAGDDLYGAHEGESLYEERPLPEPNKEFTSEEYHQLRSTGRFVQTTDGEVSSFSLESRALAMVGVRGATDESLRITTRGLATERELFVYRDRWPDHRNPHGQADTLLRVMMTEEWLEGAKATENKVYSAGDMGILWEPDGGTYGDEVTDTVDTAE